MHPDLARKPQALYNEIEPYATQWMRNLIAAGHIAPGIVNERSIKEVTAADLAGFTQAHFFAGIGCWSHALRLAGWPDELPVWTGSCPCQPFSAAGKGEGFSDERHLWPDWFRLIDECRPAIIFGEQVASPAGLAWLDAVFADLEGAGYAVGAADLCAAGVGAPHIRQRLYFVAYAAGQRLDGLDILHRSGRDADLEAARRGEAGDVAHAQGDGRRQRGADGGRDQDGDGSQRRREGVRLTDDGALGILGNTGSTRGRRDTGAVSGTQGEGQGERGAAKRRDDAAQLATPERASGATRGFWADAEWLPCSDGKARPIEPGTFPLAHGHPCRVGKLRAFGNAISPELAAAFISAFMEQVTP